MLPYFVHVVVKCIMCTYIEYYIKNPFDKCDISMWNKIYFWKRDQHPSNGFSSLSLTIIFQMFKMFPSPLKMIWFPLHYSAKKNYQLIAVIVVTHIYIELINWCSWPFFPGQSLGSWQERITMETELCMSLFPIGLAFLARRPKTTGVILLLSFYLKFCGPPPISPPHFSFISPPLLSHSSPLRCISIHCSPPSRSSQKSFMDVTVKATVTPKCGGATAAPLCFQSDCHKLGPADGWPFREPQHNGSLLRRIAPLLTPDSLVHCFDISVKSNEEQV